MFVVIFLKHGLYLETLNLEERLNQVIPVLIYHFLRDISTQFPSVCTSPVKVPFLSPCVTLAERHNFFRALEVMSICRHAGEGVKMGPLQERCKEKEIKSIYRAGNDKLG